MKHAHRTLSIYILILNLLDLLTTYISISRGGSEMNPFINAVDNWWIVSAYKVSFPIVMLISCRWIKTIYPAVLLIQSVFVFLYVAVILNNIFSF